MSVRRAAPAEKNSMKKKRINVWRNVEMETVCFSETLASTDE
jgi:hypothetical protein